jgi:UDP-2,3-diacylglucosamine hydrolase
MTLPEGKKIYFASDFHLGIPNHASSLEREKRICQWLDSIKQDAAYIFLVGDLFDAWLEFKHVVPKGFVRFLGKLAELSDAGIQIEAFTGNHDLWMRGYFQEELNIPVHHEAIRRNFNGKNFLIAHGDGLGPGDHGYKLLKGILRNPFCQWLYRRIHPDTGLGMASYFSRLGPKHESAIPDTFKGPEKEFLVQYCQDVLQTEPIDYFIFGHRHLAIDYVLNNEKSHYINLGDWLKFDSYAVFDGQVCRLVYYPKTTES